jgi:hypothetical protein
MINVDSMPVAEISEVDPDQTEFDEEFLGVPIAGAIIANRIFSKFRSTNLDFQFGSLSPVLPPPKHS